jgi:hypothetical protein
MIPTFVVEVDRGNDAWTEVWLGFGWNNAVSAANQYLFYSPSTKIRVREHDKGATP